MTSKKENDKPSDSRHVDATGADDAEHSFVKRWSERKSSEETPLQNQSESADAPDENSASAPDEPLLTDADMPTLDSLNEKSDFSVFNSPGVSDSLRHAAIGKMMHLAGLHPRDGLDDYDDDFRSFAPLGDTITADMKFEEKHKQELALEREEAQRLADSGQDNDGDTATDEKAAIDAQSGQDDDAPLAVTQVSNETIDNLPAADDADTFGEFVEVGALPSASLISWPSDSAHGQARAKSLEAFDAVRPRLSTVSLDYISEGRVLLFGTAQRALPARDYLLAHQNDDIQVTCVLVGSSAGTNADTHDTFFADAIEVKGHLGEFEVTVLRASERIDIGTLVNGKEQAPTFDIIVDTSARVLHPAQIPPPGYVDSSGKDDFNEAELAQLKSSIDELVGDFSKPRYFQYNADICAHSRSKITGCTRCIDACPTLAIRSIGETVEVDPYLCQGGGTCAAVCPSGAMTYAMPTIKDLGLALQAALKTWFEHTSGAPGILIYDDAAHELIEQAAPQLPEDILPVALEEVGSVSSELIAWLLASGVASVKLLVQPQYPARIGASLATQHAQIWPIMQPLGLAEHCWTIVTTDDPNELVRQVSEQPANSAVSQRAQFALSGDKRNDLRMAIDHLRRVHGSSPDTVPLPAGSGFGNIRVDADACTLCMSCAGVCPPAAITAAGDTPTLRFTEWSCVQCGTCEKACPENAITLEPRFVYDNDQRMSLRTLNEDEPFACVTCGKPFATTSVMKRMEEKLAGHWMFSDPEKMNRLRMCEDCRVKDMFAAEGRLHAHKPS